MTRSGDSSAYDAARSFLYERVDYERAHMPDRGRGLSLVRMRELLSRLGDPQDALRIVHVAGTKGKGSTAAMMASVLREAGLRTGLYTSPHLERVEERIAIDGASCSAADFAALVERVRDSVEQLDRAAQQRGESGPTFFEITTAMMFVHFAQREVDAAVLEVGLGGRLDSTNVCRPLVSVITSISFDHMRQLGNTLAEIASEKAGIIKPGVPVVSGVIDAEPRHVIAAAARDRGSRLFAIGEAFEFEYLGPAEEALILSSRLAYREDVDGERFSLADVTIGLPGSHQAQNGAVALATLRRLEKIGWCIPEPAVRRGLARVHCPARVELLAERPAIVLDVAHNVASVEALLQVLDERFGERPRVLIFGVSRDKEVEGMLRRLVPRFETIILTPFVENPRSMSPEELAAIVDRLPRAEVSAEANGQSAAARTSSNRPILCQNPQQAWDLARRLLTAEHMVCVTGSFFLAAEMRPILLSFLGSQHLALGSGHETIETTRSAETVASLAPRQPSRTG